MKSLKGESAVNDLFRLFMPRWQSLGKVFVVFLASALVLAAGGFNRSALAAASLMIQSIQVSPTGDRLDVVTDQPFRTSGPVNFNLVTLDAPSRVVVDFPSASLASRHLKRTLMVRQKGIQSVMISENRGTLFSNVQMTIFTDTPAIAHQIRSAIQGNQLTLSLADSGTAPLVAGGASPALNNGLMAVAATPPTPERSGQDRPNIFTQSGSNPSIQAKNRITDIFFRDGRLVLQGDAQSNIRVRNRLELHQPERVVIDLDDAVLASRELLNAVNNLSTDLGSIRVGQFDERTVRLVINTPNPEKIELVPDAPNERSLVIQQHREQATGFLASAGNWLRGHRNDSADLDDSSLMRRVGGVDSVSVDQDLPDGKTHVYLAATVPMVHRIQRTGNQVIVDLPNLDTRLPMGYDTSTIDRIASIRLDPSNGEHGSRLLLTLRDSLSDLQAKPSPDKKTLELVLDFVAPRTARNVSSDDSSVSRRLPYTARVVLDAGHGGKDMGANRAGVLEKDLNLSMAQKVRKALESRGVQVQMTRNSDVFLPLPTITAITNQARPDIFVSIHHNSSTNSAIYGLETYYYTPQSIPLARKIHSELTQTLTDVPDRGVRRAMYYVIHHTPVPAVLCEIGYVSNAGERARLQDEDRQRRAAEAIADGVVAYLRTMMTASAKK